MSLTVIGSALSGVHLISANAGLSLMWGLGALFGTALTGVAMDLMGSVDFPVSIAAVYLVLVTICVFVRPVRSLASDEAGYGAGMDR